MQIPQPVIEPPRPEIEREPKQNYNHAAVVDNENVHLVIRECNELMAKFQMNMQEFYRNEMNFLNNLPRELVNTIVEHQNQTAR